jgi:phosphohistidine phosphatase
VADVVPTTPEGERVVALLRHAKSDWPEGVADLRRPLAERGRRDAPVAGRLLLERVGIPDLVLVSPAQRTRETWDLAKVAFARPPHTELSEAVYDASVDDLLLLLRDLSSRVSSVVIVGHNPGLEELAFALDDGQGDHPATARMGEKFPTSALAVLTTSREWGHLVFDSCRLRSFDVARG